MNQYEYAKDNRTDDKYQSDFGNGTYNQELAIQQLIIDRYIEYGIRLKCIQNPDKAFQKEKGYWQYNPDYIVIHNEIEIPTEVKVQMTSLKDDLDLKVSQIDRLIQLRGAILYATKTKYCLIYAQVIKDIGKIVESARFGNKKVYQVSTKELDWNYWIHYPEFRDYKNNERYRYRSSRAN